MSTIRFSSWAQTAVGQAIDTPDRPGALPAAGFTPGVSLVDSSGHSTPVAVPAPMTMLGPESVASLDPRAVVRTDPAAGAGDVEDNYLVSVDLRPIELPWLFTPARADGGRLRPWIVLVVVEVATSRLVPGVPVPTLSVDAGQLPDLSDSWAWAHVQRADDPADHVARLLCPRLLQATTRYRACIVPAFIYSASDHSYSPSWQIDQAGGVNVPVYYTWEFGTGEHGDFEYLVRRLGPAAPDRVAHLGTVFVDVAKPWPNDHELDGAPHPALYPIPGVLGQLDTGGTAAPAFSESVTHDFAVRITTQCNTGAGEPRDPEGEEFTAVTPPIYGGRHVVVDRLDPSAGDVPEWLHTLNTSIPTRIAAGLGAEYVRANQESMMARAWEQVGAIREANRRRALGQLSENVSAALHEKHVANLTLGEAVSVAAPMASRVRPWGPPGPSLATTIEVSVMPTAAGSTAFARMMRPGGQVARAASVRAGSVIERAISGAVPVPSARHAPSFAVPDVDAPAIASAVTAAAVDAQRSISATRELLRLQAISDVARVIGLHDVADLLTEKLSGVGVDATALRVGDFSTLRAQVMPRLGDVTASVATMRAQLTEPTETGGAVTSSGVQLDPNVLRSNLVGALAPAGHIARAIAAQIAVPDRMGPQVSLDPLMDHPSFPAPMALALRDFAPKWFLPGITDFPAESTTLLGVNNAFIESFLVGTAHEFNRELLWREYPTDMRGTPFRRFWPVPDADPQIDEIASWSGPLGSHLTLSEDAIAVLLVRGTVVRRFPSMIVAAAPGIAGAAEGDRPVANTDTASWRAPLFTLPVDESTALYAFGIPSQELRTMPTRDEPGWFFAFQENSTRIRFGFDVGPAQAPGFATWDDLTWDRVLDALPKSERPFARAGATLAGPENPGDKEWNRDAADMARIALQKPFRMLIHASELVIHS
ncbi:hypothetical protein FK535_07260 [Mycolicibacterium sp. 018/SC-01/001]|uniref:hypothetical protein n=1 Tax=Mycolicibacterium sp. 018/SC-01/001 TaxID=2592069 RepID=UPI00118175EB|nr:hypothetical protein [Mycolicibacterium sp. 018/SC-01/001]TRW86254.1 hypothetical protein FK535_07260 [Mycolicibacterium sp. 018/SC-01/001]